MNCQREQNKAEKTREHLLCWNEIRLTVSVQMVSTPPPIAHPRSCLTGLASAHGAAWLGTGWGCGVCESGRRRRFIKKLRLIFMWPVRTPGVRRQRGRESLGMNCSLFLLREKGISVKKKTKPTQISWELPGNCPPLNTSGHFLQVLQPPLNLSLQA